MYKTVFAFKICTLFFYDGIIDKRSTIKPVDKSFFKRNRDGFLNNKKSLERIDKYNKCYLTNQKKKIIGYHWLKISQYIPLFFGMNFKVKQKGAIIWDCKTKDEFREKSVYKNGVISILSMKKLKKLRKYILIDNKKKYLLKSIKVLGFQKVNTFLCLKFFNISFKVSL
tara:strand:+ start:326 stop:832 length:507 start_codon:yes stop_codon:yes gene_type:complete